MNRDELLAKWDSMEPRERDALVAEKVMGLKIPNRHNARFYSTDISAAYEILPVMRRLFSRRTRFAKEMQDLMNADLITADADIRIAPTEIVWHMTAINLCKAALLSLIEEDKPCTTTTHTAKRQNHGKRFGTPAKTNKA